MKNQKGHYHSLTLFTKVSWLHFWYLWLSLVLVKLKKGKSLTAHLPLEIQHPHIFKQFWFAIMLIRWGEVWKKALKVKLYWENSPLLNVGTWNLKFGQTDWNMIPQNIDLCLDTGHLMLGSREVAEARRRINKVLKEMGTKICHLHLHENNLANDQHLPPGKVLDKELLARLTQGRTYIYERG